MPGIFHRSYGKRLFDLLITLPALLALAPFLLLLALLVRRKLGAPVLFRQQRPGLHGKPFTLYKFRTMTDARDAQGRPTGSRAARRGSAKTAAVIRNSPFSILVSAPVMLQ